MGKLIYKKLIERVSCAFIVLFFIINQGILGYAEPAESVTVEEIIQAEKDALYQLPVQTNTLQNWPTGPQTYAQSSIVMDMDSGAILYAKNIDERLYPASITKLVTTLVALENAKLTNRVHVTEDSVSFLESGYAQIGLRAGEEISMEEALFATLLKSANEAAYAVGENTGEGYDWFLMQMNQWAEQVGANNSHFTNTHGLHDDEHYTTTRDMALLGSALFEYPEAFEIMQTAHYIIPPTNVDSEEKHMWQNHKMLQSEHAQYYEYAIGGKTGFTNEARTTLVTFASRDNKNLVCVTMKSWAEHVYDDTRNLLEYGFQNFEKVSILEEYLPKEVESIEENAYVMLPAGIVLQDLESTVVQDLNEAHMGTLTYTYEGQEVGTAYITLDVLLEEEQIEGTAMGEDETTSKRSRTNVIWIIGIIVGILILFMMRIIWVVRKKREKRRRRRRQKRRTRR